MREPGVDGTGPLAQVELRQEWLVYRFQRGEDGTDFFGGVASDAAERGQFVETTTKLQPGRVRQIERLFQWNRVSAPCRHQTQPKRMIVREPPLVRHFLEQHQMLKREIVCIIDNQKFSPILVQVSHEFGFAGAPMSS